MRKESSQIHAVVPTCSRLYRGTYVAAVCFFAQTNVADAGAGSACCALSPQRLNIIMLQQDVHRSEKPSGYRSDHDLHPLDYFFRSFISYRSFRFYRSFRYFRSACRYDRLCRIRMVQIQPRKNMRRFMRIIRTPTLQHEREHTDHGCMYLDPERSRSWITDRYFPRYVKPVQSVAEFLRENHRHTSACINRRRPGATTKWHSRRG